MAPLSETTEVELRLRLSRQVSDELAHRAATSGRDLSAVASDLLEQAVKPMTGKGEIAGGASVEAWDKWVAGMRHWADGNLPGRRMIDDSRESIYEGRGE